MKAAIAFAGLLLAAAATAFVLFLASPQTGSIAISNAVARPGKDPGSVVVNLTLVGEGGPDTLIGVQSDVAAGADLAGVDQGRMAAIPQDTPIVLSSDGAQIVLTGIEGELQDGRLLPISLRFERAGDVAVRARLQAGDAMDRMASHAGWHCNGCWDGDPPEITLRVRELDEGWLVETQVRNFTFSRDAADGKHAPGVGHGHLYLNGLKLGRVFGEPLTVGALPAGEHIFSVSLNTNDHRVYVLGHTPIAAQVWVVAR